MSAPLNKDKDVTTATAEPMSTTETAPAAAAAQKIHWAAEPGKVKSIELEEKLEVMRARNWVTERMIEQSQKHWHCSREEALERLIEQTA